MRYTIQIICDVRREIAGLSFSSCHCKLNQAQRAFAPEISLGIRRDRGAVGFQPASAGARWPARCAGDARAVAKRPHHSLAAGRPLIGHRGGHERRHEDPGRGLRCEA